MAASKKFACAKETAYTTKPINELLREEDDVGMRIVGGIEVNPKFKYEYMVYAGGCGASLVAPNVLLSAAHCFNAINTVHIGRHNIFNSTEEYEVFDIVQKVRHPQYDDNIIDYDFMMLKLDRPSTRTPVELDAGDISLDSGRDVVVMGWGTTSSGGASSNVLLEVEVDLKSEVECQESYPGEPITSRMVCAARAGKDSCQGDSGGPLIDRATGKQVGIVSWGYGCALDQYPGVYAKVQDQIDWIQGYIDQWGTSVGPTPSPTLSPLTPPSPTPSPTPSGPTDTTCTSIFRKGRCNRTVGCSWKGGHKSACFDALTSEECQQWDGERRKCRIINGCVWDTESKMCSGRWE